MGSASSRSYVLSSGTMVIVLILGSPYQPDVSLAGSWRTT